MNIRDHIRLRQAQEIDTSLQVNGLVGKVITTAPARGPTPTSILYINGMIGKAIASKRLLVQIISLDHRRHRPIEQQNAL